MATQKGFLFFLTFFGLLPTLAVASLIQVYQPEERSHQIERRPPFADFEIQAVYTSEPPHIDGNLSDSVWQQTSETTGFLHRHKTKKEIAMAQSYVRVLYDDKNLYIGCKFDEPYMDKLVAQYDQDDLNIWSDDCFELLIDTKGTAETFYHFVINSLGAVYDSRAGQRQWNSNNTEVVASVGKDYWVLEIAIPFADLDVSPSYGDTWGVKVCRERKTDTGTEIYSALPLQTRAFNQYQDLGKLTFTYADTSATKTIEVKKVREQQPSFGYNLFAYQIVNKDREKLEGTLKLKGVDTEGTEIFAINKPVAVNHGGKTTIEIPFSISSRDNLDFIAVSLYDSKSNKYCFSQKIPCLKPASPSLEEIEAIVDKIESNFRLFLDGKNPLVLSANKSIEKIKNRINVFSKTVTEAIAAKETVGSQRWDSLRAEISGFYSWYLKYRFLLWSPDIWENNLDTDFPSPAEYKNNNIREIKIKMAGNEIEQAGLSISGLALAQPRKVQLIVDRLVRAGGDEFINPDNIKLYQVAAIRDGAKKLNSNLLVENSGNVFTVIPGRTTHLWLEIWSRTAISRVPVSGEKNHVPPGKYSGKLTIRPLDVLESPVDCWTEIPITVEVWPFRLPEPKDMPLDTFAWGGTVLFHNLPQVNMVRDSYKHRLNWVMADWWRIMPRSIGKWKEFNAENLKNYQGLSNNDEMLEEAKKMGMKVMYAWNNTGNPYVCAAVAEHMKNLGFSYNEFASMSQSDEFGHEDVPKFLKFHKKMVELDPSMRFMATYISTPPPHGPTSQDIETLAPYIEIWMNYLSRLWPQSETKCQINLEQIKNQKKKHGNIIGLYQCSRNMRRQSLVDYYRLFPWKAWELDAEMIAYWTYCGWERGASDTYNTLEHPQEGFVHYGNGGELVPTKHYEAFREGLEDFCYLHILEKRIENTRKEGKNVESSEEILSQAKSDAFQAKRMSDFLPIREMVAAEIINLRNYEE